VPGRQLVDPRRLDRAAQRADADACHRAPREREADHEQRLLLIDVDVVQVERRDGRHQHRRAGQRKRE
jgi:hypothetical protein